MHILNFLEYCVGRGQRLTQKAGSAHASTKAKGKGEQRFFSRRALELVFKNTYMTIVD